MPNNQTVKQSMARINAPPVQRFIGTITAVDVLSRGKTGITQSISPRITCNIHGINGLRSVELSQAIDPNTLAVGNQILIEQLNDRYVAVALMPVTSRTAGGGVPVGNDQNQIAIVEPPVPEAVAHGEVTELVWEAVNGATEYEVFRGTSDDPDDAESIATVSGTRYVTTDPEARSDQYYYFVIARKGMESSDISDPVLIDRQGSNTDGMNSPGLESGVAGRLTVTDAMGVLLRKVTTVNSPVKFTLDIADPITGHAAIFTVNDILKCRAKTGEPIYLKVTDVYDQTTYYQYAVTKQDPGAGINYVIPAGSMIIGLGVSGQGWVEIVASGNNAPKIRVRTHAGAPWSVQTERVVIGNLAGITDPTFGALSGWGMWTENAYLTGGINATMGKIANWLIGVVDANTLSAASGKVKINSATPSITLGEAIDSGPTGFDSANKGIWLGRYTTGDWRIKIGGRNTGDALFAFDNTDVLIKNSNIEMWNGAVQTGNIGKAGNGWFGKNPSNRVLEWTSTGGDQGDVRMGGSDDYAWWNDDVSTMYIQGNIQISGEFHTAVMVKDAVRTEAGTLIIATNGGITDEAKTTTAGSQTLKIKDMAGAAIGAVNDRLRIKTNAGDNWFTITAVGSLVGNSRTYTLTRNSGSNASYPKGVAVTNYGGTSGGVLYLTSDLTNGPFYSIRTHTGSPWASETEVVRLGKLSGIIDPVFGSMPGYGLWTNSVYLTGSINATAGLISGVLTIGASGGFYQGTGTFATPTTGLKIYNSGGVGLVEMWGGGIKQVYFNSSGQLRTGGGTVYLDVNGLTFDAPAVPSTPNVIKWVDNLGNNVGEIYGQHDATSGNITRLQFKNYRPANNGYAYMEHATVNAFHGTTIAMWVRGDSSADTYNRIEITVRNTDMAVMTTTGLRLGSHNAPSVLLHVGDGTATSVVPTTIWGNVDYSGNADHLLAGFLASHTGGTGAPSIQALEGWSRTAHTSGAVSLSLGVIGHTEHNGAGTVGKQVAFESSNVTNSGAGLITDSYNFRASPFVRLGGGSATNVYGFYADTMTASGVTNKWAFYSAGASDKSYFAGQVGIGALSPTSGYALETDRGILVNSSNANAGFVARNTGATSPSVGPQNAFIANDGAAMGNADRLGTLLFYGYNSSSVQLSAGMIVSATEDWSTSVRGSKITFYITLTGTNTLTQTMILEGNGGVSILAGNLVFADTRNIQVNTGTGTKIGTATGQKIGFWNQTPTIQPTTAHAAATFVAGAGTAVNDASTFDGYTMKQVVRALRTIGLLA